MRTYALAAWLILCAGIGTTSGQQPSGQTGDPFLNSGLPEQARAPLSESRRYGLTPDATSPEPGMPPFGEDPLALQYPLDQDDYRPPTAPPEPRNWVPPVISRPEETSHHDEPWVRFKSTKAAVSHVGSGGSMGITTFQVRPTLEFPAVPGVFVTPNLGWHVLAGPTTTDLPARFYDASLDLAMYRPVGDDWLVQVAIVPGIYTDGNNTSSDALRIQGRLMGFYTMPSGNQLVLGIVYLDREDVPVLPTIGLILQPRDDLRYELMFPKPRLAWRQSVTADWEQWVYATGELGGGSWAVRRATGLDDIATYRDLRFVLGVERKHAAGCGWYVEGGYVFGRELEFDSNAGNVSFDETAFIRVGGSF